jgi:teichuronic acid biosynthesis glycosyltransferase TuaC
MLRIAVVTAHFPSSAQPTHGRPAYQTVRVLTETCAVQVFYPHATYPALLRPRTRIYRGIDPAYSLPGVNAAYYNYPALPALSRPFNGHLAARTLLPHVRAFAPDLIFSYFLYPDGYAALKLGKALKVPVVVMGVGSDVHNIKDRFSAMHTRTVVRNADFVLAISEDLRQRIVDMGARPAKTRAIVSGCDLAVFHPMDRIDARQKLNIDPLCEAVVYIGRMDVRKGLRELVEASVSLHSARPNMRVYLIGAGADRSAIDSAIQAANAADYIHALPECSFDEVATWMTAADLVTLPSYMEGCPNVVLEALACGRPVVATSVGGIPELMPPRIVDQCGRLVPPRDPAALASAIESVLDQTWDAAAIAANAGRGWPTVAAEVMEVFKPLVENTTPAAGRQ